MNELPKELTPELLGLILNIEPSDFNREINTLDGEYLNYGIFTINIDTLTRLMKEWCYEQDYKVSTERIDMSNDRFNHKWYLGLNKYWWFHGVSEFEAVLKATQWVAKEKRLI